MNIMARHKKTKKMARVKKIDFDSKIIQIDPGELVEKIICIHCKVPCFYPYVFLEEVELIIEV